MERIKLCRKGFRIRSHKIWKIRAKVTPTLLGLKQLFLYIWSLVLLNPKKILWLLVHWSNNTLVCITQKTAKKVPVAIGSVNCKIKTNKQTKKQMPRVGNNYFVKYLFDTATLNQNELQIHVH